MTDTVAADLVAALTAAGQTIAVAESLTGGAVLDALVAVAGASACVRGGVVAYATDVKRDLLGVPATLLDAHGPVHPEVALAMAEGARRVLRADLGLATTGVAGPDPVAGHRPGEAYVAVAGAGASQVVRVQAPGRDRAGVRAAARDAALVLAIRALRRAGDAPG